MKELYPDYTKSSILFENFLRLMDSSTGDKLRHTVLYLPQNINNPGEVLLSIGAGTGKLEHTLKEMLPQATIVALDYSLPMIEEIQGQNTNNSSPDLKEILPLLGNAKNIPLKPNSVSVVSAFSVVHELGSFGDGYELGPTTTSFFQEAARVLKPGGRLIIRDFMQPSDPNKDVYIEVGKKVSDSDTDPTQFVYDFITQFKGDDLSYLSSSLQSLKIGSRLKMKYSHALELAIHYSWSKRFADEVKEKYAYLPIDEYTQNVIDCMSQKGHSVSLVATDSYLQPGYPDHINGRINLLNKDGSSLPLPPFTGIVVIEKN